MIRCVIADDEDLARRHMARLLEAHADCEIVSEAANGVEALEAISETQPDVVFLDIEMPGLNAFDMLTQLRHPPLIVFATAFDKYAISAFDANALDYLLKPIQPARLAQAVEKIRATLKKPREQYESMLQRAVSTMRGGPPSKLAARRGKRIVLLSPADILCILVTDQIVFFHTQTERFATDRTISELEELLEPAGFFRVSRSAIVNLHHARELLPWSSGTWKVKLSNSLELDVSRDRSRALRAKIG
jgi:DNA-binding LytR/AlgR family response regulator